MNIKGTIKIKSYTANQQQLLRALSVDPRTRSLINNLADDTVAEGQRRLVGSAGTETPKGVEYEKINGVYWSANPVEVARKIQKKDASQVFASRRGQVRVGLVINNHPYAVAYEQGGFGAIPATKAMAAAVRAVAGRYPGVSARMGTGI